MPRKDPAPLVMPRQVPDHRPPVTVLLALLKLRSKSFSHFGETERPGQWKAGTPNPRAADQHDFHMAVWLCSHLGPHREKKGSYRNGWVLTQRKGHAECPQDRPKGWGHSEQKVHRRSTCPYCPPSGLETASSTLWVIGRGDAVTSCCTTL